MLAIWLRAQSYVELARFRARRSALALLPFNLMQEINLLALHFAKKCLRSLWKRRYNEQSIEAEFMVLLQQKFRPTQCISFSLLNVSHQI